MYGLTQSTYRPYEIQQRHGNGDVQVKQKHDAVGVVNGVHCIRQRQSFMKRPRLLEQGRFSGQWAFFQDLTDVFIGTLEIDHYYVEIFVAR